MNASPSAFGRGHPAETEALATLQRSVEARYPNCLDYIGYAAFHLACLGAIWTEFDRTLFVLTAACYLLAMTGASLCQHRYFGHRAFETSRGFQFVLAIWGILSVEKGPLWWASLHRHHHRHADTPDDIHAPGHQGALFAYMGWFLHHRLRNPDLRLCPALATCPELIWLTRHNYIPIAIYAAVIWLGFGWSGLVWGFFIPTVLVWHGTHMITCTLHSRVGYRNFATRDDSSNSRILGLLLLGEGYHNNHHRFPYSARLGAARWEFDVTWWLIRLLERLGLIWNVRQMPIESGRHPEPLTP